MSALPPIHGCHHHPVIHARYRHVEPIGNACRAADFKPLPFDTFLKRQNEEARAATRPGDFLRALPADVCPRETPATHRFAPVPAVSSWARIGDVPPAPPHPPTARLRTLYQLSLPLQPGRLIDLLL